MRDDMGGIMVGVGALMLFFIVFEIGFYIYKVEFVMPSTFESGLVKIDDNISYKCVPTEKTIKYRELQKQIKDLSKELNESKN